MSYFFDFIVTLANFSFLLRVTYDDTSQVQAYEIQHTSRCQLDTYYGVVCILTIVLTLPAPSPDYHPVISIVHCHRDRLQSMSTQHCGVAPFRRIASLCP